MKIHEIKFTLAVMDEAEDTPDEVAEWMTNNAQERFGVTATMFTHLKTTDVEIDDPDLDDEKNVDAWMDLAFSEVETLHNAKGPDTQGT